MRQRATDLHCLCGEYMGSRQLRQRTAKGKRRTAWDKGRTAEDKRRTAWDKGLCGTMDCFGQTIAPKDSVGLRTASSNGQHQTRQRTAVDKGLRQRTLLELMHKTTAGLEQGASMPLPLFSKQLVCSIDNSQTNVTPLLPCSCLGHVLRHVLLIGVLVRVPWLVKAQTLWTAPRTLYPLPRPLAQTAQNSPQTARTARSAETVPAP